jgi:hypothetical protein
LLFFPLSLLLGHLLCLSLFNFQNCFCWTISLVTCGEFLSTSFAAHHKSTSPQHQFPTHFFGQLSLSESELGNCVPSQPCTPSLVTWVFVKFCRWFVMPKIDVPTQKSSFLPDFCYKYLCNRDRPFQNSRAPNFDHFSLKTDFIEGLINGCAWYI